MLSEIKISSMASSTMTFAAIKLAKLKNECLLEKNLTSEHTKSYLITLLRSQNIFDITNVAFICSLFVT